MYLGGGLGWMLKGIDTIIYIHMFKEYSLCHIKVLSVYQLLYTFSTDLVDVRTPIGTIGTVYMKHALDLYNIYVFRGGYRISARGGQDF